MNTDDVIGLLKNTRKSKYSNLMPMGIKKGYTLNDIRVTVLEKERKCEIYILNALHPVVCFNRQTPRPKRTIKFQNM